MGIDEAITTEDSIKIINNMIEDFEEKYQDSRTINAGIAALKRIVKAYNDLKEIENDLKQIEEAHRIENGKLREEIKIKDEYLDLIQFMAVDYDGERKAKGLMELIDQLADYAVKGLNCDTKSEIYWGKNILRENIESHIPHID